MEDIYSKISEFASEVKLFFNELTGYLIRKLHLSFIRFELGKSIFVTALYRQRGKLARRLIHSGMAGLALAGMMIAPVIAEEFPGRSVNPWDIPSPSSVVPYATNDPYTETQVSVKGRAEAVEYNVLEGDTVSSIAGKFGVSAETISWENNLDVGDRIKIGQTLKVLPVTGISHKVKKGDTVYSIAKKYDVEAQQIVNYPFNAYSNDESFELAIGQIIMVPDGVLAKALPAGPRTRQLTPDAGTVVASGAFVWPASGRITQNFVWYHKGLDIANNSSPNILAADSGVVVGAGWLDGYGYGNRVIIDHRNGYRTLYAHMSSVFVVAGQTVSRGSAVGKMGCTGRCTGTHLHFEVIKNGVYLNPLSVLQ